MVNFGFINKIIVNYLTNKYYFILFIKNILFKVKILNLGRNSASDKLDFVVFHIFSNYLCTLLVKATKQNGAYHDCHIQTQTSKKTSTLQRHIRCPHTQSLSRTIWQRKKVITGRKQVQCRHTNNTKASTFRITIINEFQFLKNHLSKNILNIQIYSSK